MSNWLEALQKNQRETPLESRSRSEFSFRNRRAYLFPQGRDPLRPPAGLRVGTDRSCPAGIHLRGWPSDRSVDVLRSGAPRNVGEGTRARHRLAEDPSWRAEF